MGRTTMGGDNRLVLDHACCLLSRNAIVDVGKPLVDSFEEMGTTASSMLSAAWTERGHLVRAGPCLLPSGDSMVDARFPTGEPLVDVEEMGTTPSSMPGAGCVNRRTMGGHFLLQRTTRWPSGDAIHAQRLTPTPQ
jgi:hypothetical protein